MDANRGTRDSPLGSVVLCRGADERLGMIAGTQLDTVFLSGEELVAHLPTLEDGVKAALELAAWDRSLAGPSTEVRTVAVGAGSGRDIAAALNRGRSLLEQAPAGRACLEAGDVERCRIDWVTAADGIDGLACMRWAGPGREPGAPASRSAASSARTAPMIGRRAALQELARAWADAHRDSTRMALVAGQPGSGKTRLVSEAAAEIEQAGGSVLCGAGEESEAAPYAPFITAFGSAAAVEGGPSPTFSDLVRGADAAREAPASAGLGVEPSALFNAAVAELEHRCLHSPTALIIEDLHDCSPSSLRLLNHLLRSPDLSRLLIIGTYRPTDLDPETPQAGLIGEMRRQSRASHLDLGPLNARALRGLAASLGVEPRMLEQAADVAAEETGGVPLYAGELLRAIAADDRIEPVADIPRSLQVLIESRVRALGPAVHDHLSAGAVAGNSFDPNVVAAAAEIDSDELAESLRLAERAGVLEQRSEAPEHVFGHALTRRCLYESLSPARRGALHRRLALALERQAADGASVEPGMVARHWEQAEPPDRTRAGEWAVHAANRALERFDPAAAVEWYERALELEDRAQKEYSSRRCDLLLGLGAALRLQGSPRFRDVLLEAGRLALELDDPARLGAAVLTNDRGFISAVGDFDRERLALLELAVERVEDESTRPLLLAQLALELVFAPGRERRHDLAEEALGLARAGDNPALLARVLNRYLLARWEPGNARERIKIANESVRVGARLDGPLDLFHGLHWRAVAQLEACEIEGALRSTNEEVRIAARLGDPTADWLSACSVALRYTLLGKLEEAEAEAERAAALGQASGQPDALPFYAGQIAAIRWQQGRLGELTPLLDAALEQNPGIPGFRGLVAMAHTAAGNDDGAREVLEIDSADGFEKLPRDPIWISSTVNYAHAVAELGDVGAAESLSDQLQPMLGQVATSSVGYWGLTDHAVGRLQATLGRMDEAILLLDRSIHEYARFPSPVWRGQAMLELAAVLREADRDEGRQAALESEARAIGVRLKAGVLRGADGDGAPPAAGDRLRSEERLEALDLTDRQRDIVVLLARGMTNAEIATELAISPRTVKRHVEDASARTGVRGRKGLLAMFYE